MKKIFIEGKYEGDLVIPEKVIHKLPEKLVLALPVQFLDFLEQIKAQLESAGKNITLFRSKHGHYPGQILGCDIFELKGKYDAFLYLGDGKFHPTALLYDNKRPVYCYNPFNQQLEIIDCSDLEKLKKRKKGLLAKFLSVKKVGILVTTKSGQNQTKVAEQLREKLEKKGKQVFVFLDDNISFNSLENFNFIEAWINTACPRIVEDFPALNPEDLKPFLN